MIQLGLKNIKIKSERDEKLNELLTVKYDEYDEPVVSARELHKALGVSHRFNDWMNTNKKLFIENEDYTTVPVLVEVQNNGGIQTRKLNDYLLKIETAKHFCMMSRTEKGKEIRQYFIDVEKAYNSPEQIMSRALKLADKTIAKLTGENQKLIEEVNVKNQVIGELKPKADYTDKILQNKGLVTITQIAKDYGMTGQEMNRKLHELGIQFKQSDQWLLYRKYQGLGYTHSETVDITRADGRPDIKMNTKWTQKGRLFLYNKLKEIGIIPAIER